MCIRECCSGHDSSKRSSLIDFGTNSLTSPTTSSSLPAVCSVLLLPPFNARNKSQFPHFLAPSSSILPTSAHLPQQSLPPDLDAVRTGCFGGVLAPICVAMIVGKDAVNFVSELLAAGTDGFARNSQVRCSSRLLHVMRGEDR